MIRVVNGFGKLGFTLIAAVSMHPFAVMAGIPTNRIHLIMSGKDLEKYNKSSNATIAVDITTFSAKEKIPVIVTSKDDPIRPVMPITNANNTARYSLAAGIWRIVFFDIKDTCKVDFLDGNVFLFTPGEISQLSTKLNQQFSFKIANKSKFVKRTDCLFVALKPIPDSAEYIDDNPLEAD